MFDCFSFFESWLEHWNWNQENGTDGLGNDQNDQDDQDDQDEEKMIRTELMNISTKKEENVIFYNLKNR